MMGKVGRYRKDIKVPPNIITINHHLEILCEGGWKDGTVNKVKYPGLFCRCNWDVEYATDLADIFTEYWYDNKIALYCTSYILN